MPEPMTDETTGVCSNCDGAGMVLVVNAAGVRVARVCSCQEALRGRHRIQVAQIPKRYEHCGLDNFDIYRGADPTLAAALTKAQQFVREYPVGTSGVGLLFSGSIGVGKTHLSVGILSELIQKKGCAGLFCDYRELLKQIQHSYNPQVNSTELDVLKPVFEAEVLVIDELGAQKPTDWVWDTVALILNARYNDKRTTIITSNYPDLPPAGTGGATHPKLIRDETLGDRIGERMRSRLKEMCVCVNMLGKDFRQTVRSAQFG